jgi:hypothetical protein
MDEFLKEHGDCDLVGYEQERELPLDGEPYIEHVYATFYWFYCKEHGVLSESELKHK